METLELPVEEDVSEWGDAAPPRLEDQEMDILAFELWRDGSLPVPEDES